MDGYLCFWREERAARSVVLCVNGRATPIILFWRLLCGGFSSESSVIESAKCFELLFTGVEKEAKLYDEPRPQDARSPRLTAVANSQPEVFIGTIVSAPGQTIYDTAIDAERHLNGQPRRVDVDCMRCAGILQRRKPYTYWNPR